MEKNPQDLSALLRGSPWYASALRGSRVDRVIVLWLRIGRRSRLEGFVAQVVARDGTLIDRPIIGGTVWTIDRGVRSAILDERRRSLEEGWSHVLEITSQPTAIVGHRLAALHRALLESLPRAMRSSFIHTTLVDLHEAASLLRRSRIADASGRGTLLEVRSASLVDLAALAGVPVSEAALADDDLRAAAAASAVWARLLLPRFATIPTTAAPEESPEPLEERSPSRSTLPAEIAAILDAPLDDEPPGPVTSEPTPSLDRPSYSGVPVDGGWRLVRGGRAIDGPIAGEALARVIVRDLDGSEPDPARVERLLARVVAELPDGLAFEISVDDLRSILD
jgi:hypothetical protein